MTDAYEREAMPGIGEVLHRHKVTSPRWALALVLGLPLGLATIAAAGLALGGQLLGAASLLGGALALSAITTFVMVTFATARIAISEGEIHVQLGFAGPRIPIAEVVGVKVAPSGSNRMGMGVRSDLRGTTLMTLWGDNQRAVHIERTNGTKLVLVCKEPEAMARAIDEALARRDRKAPKVRIADVDENVAEADAHGSERTKAADRARAE